MLACDRKLRERDRLELASLAAALSLFPQVAQARPGGQVTVIGHAISSQPPTGPHVWLEVMSIAANSDCSAR